MPIPFIIPKMDMDQEDVVIAQWLKKEGEFVKKGEVVIIIETDKITSEVEAPANGQLTHLLYQENETAPVTKVVAYILEEGETLEDLPDQPKHQPEVIEDRIKTDLRTTEKPRVATALAKHMAEVEGIDLDDVIHVSDKITKQDVENHLRDRTKPRPRVETPATPAARRLAQENRIDLSNVNGSGPRNRVQATDVTHFVEQEVNQEHSVKNAMLPSRKQELSTMRRIIADRLTASYQKAPHIYLSIEADMSQFETTRKKLNDDAQRMGFPKITVTTLLIKILSLCLKHHPYLNASIEKETINFWNDINIGVATSITDGLIVPVIHKADQLSINDLNKLLKSYTERARERRLSLEEIQGGTFTISNLGMYGINSFTSIINPPQSAILSVGAIKRKLVVVDNEDSLNIRPILNLNLAADHRIVDGVVAANFLRDLVDTLESSNEFELFH